MPSPIETPTDQRVDIGVELHFGHGKNDRPSVSPRAPEMPQSLSGKAYLDSRIRQSSESASFSSVDPPFLASNLYSNSTPKRPRPLCRGMMTPKDVREGLNPIYDVDFIPHTDGRYRRFTEGQADYKSGGYSKTKIGDRLNHERYQVVNKIGVGHFGVVYLCWDRM